MGNEYLTPLPTLEQQLNPLLQQIRQNESGSQNNYEVVKNWFDIHTENLSADLADFAYLCTLPNSERQLLTYPVIGNWFLAKLGNFQAQSPEQREIIGSLNGLITEMRFNNSHTGKFYGDKESYGKKHDELDSLMLSYPDQAIPVCDALNDIKDEIVKAVEDRQFPQSDQYTIDVPHGLISPALHFTFLVSQFSLLEEHEATDPLNLTVMVVDDEQPEEWYKRLMSVGFKDQQQQGYFFDCESALSALEENHYDVILTDLELGEGKMNGIDFVEAAYEIQSKKGLPPIISVFSYSQQKLDKAEEQLRTIPGQRSESPRVISQVNGNNKVNFTAMEFRLDVSAYLHRNSEQD